MTVKGFFKSNVFKCLATLLCVLLISGIFLTLMNGLLAVSDEERFARAISKIYGKSVAYTEVDVADYNDNSTIEAAYRIKDDGNYLVKSTGKGGFDNGTVTCWVVVECKNGAVTGIGKVVIESNKGQSYIDRVTDKALNQFSELYKNEIVYSPNLITNATVTGTKNAICNAVNGAIDYVNGKWLGNVAVDIYEDFELTDYIDTKQTNHETDEEGNVVFHIVTKGHTMPTGFKINVTVNAQGIVTAYEIEVNGSTSQTYVNKMSAEILNGTLFVGKDFAGIQQLINEGITYPGDNKETSISTGATQSNYLCVYAAAFATKNYDKCIPENPDGGEVTPPDGGDETGNGESEEGGNE